MRPCCTLGRAVHGTAVHGTRHPQEKHRWSYCPVQPASLPAARCALSVAPSAAACDTATSAMDCAAEPPVLPNHTATSRRGASPGRC
eukprot:scaffold5050_cov93-Isochrysis_galbana.AAC.5